MYIINIMWLVAPIALLTILFILLMSKSLIKSKKVFFAFFVLILIYAILGVACYYFYEKFSSMDEYYQALKNTNYDLLLIEVSYNNVFFTEEQIEELKIKNNGGKRIVIAYLSIGEAEDYRFYWNKKWNKKKPNWIVKENENWEGNYIVKYWSPEWKSTIKEYQKKLDEIGVDGYLLDTVDTYQYFEENYKKTLE